MCVVHAWEDEVIPVEQAIRFCQQESCAPPAGFGSSVNVRAGKIEAIFESLPAETSPLAFSATGIAPYGIFRLMSARNQHISAGTTNRVNNVCQ